MCATAANLVEHVLPEQVALRQWVLTFPFPWRGRLARDGELLGALTRIFVESVERRYTSRAPSLGAGETKTGAVIVVQRTSSDMRLNPHLHVVFLDGAYRERDGELAFEQLAQLRTRDVGEVLEHAVRRMTRHLRRRTSSAALELREALSGEPDGEGDEAEQRLATSAVSGREPPAGPQWLRGLPPVRPAPLAYDKPLCASLDGFTLHAATRAGALDVQGREKLLRYVLRPPIAQERVEHRPDGLVRIALKRAFADGTIAVDMDPLSLLCRLATAVPSPRFHTVKYAGVLASASRWRSRIAPPPKQLDTADACGEADAPKKRAKGNATYWPWADLLRRTFAVDVLECPSCKGRMKLVAMVTKHDEITRYLTALGEPTTVPERSPSRGPPYWASTVLRRKALGHVA